MDSLQWWRRFHTFNPIKKNLNVVCIHILSFNIYLVKFWSICMSNFYNINGVDFRWELVLSKCMVEWLNSNNSDFLRFHIIFLHIMLNLFNLFLYSFFVVYEIQLNQKYHNIFFKILIIMLIKTYQNLVKV